MHLSSAREPLASSKSNNFRLSSSQFELTRRSKCSLINRIALVENWVRGNRDIQGRMCFNHIPPQCKIIHEHHNELLFRHHNSDNSLTKASALQPWIFTEQTRIKKPRKQREIKKLSLLSELWCVISTEKDRENESSHVVEASVRPDDVRVLAGRIQKIFPSIARNHISLWLLFGILANSFPPLPLSLQRPDENLDVSLSVPQYNGHPPPSHLRYHNLNDQVSSSRCAPIKVELRAIKRYIFFSPRSDPWIRNYVPKNESKALTWRFFPPFPCQSWLRRDRI